MGCDSPAALFESASKAAAEITPEADFVLFTGDFVRHGQDRLRDPWNNVTGIVRKASEILASAFPGMKSEHFGVGTLGNDDSPRNYELNITTDAASNEWLSDVGSVFVQTGTMPTDAASDYYYGGYWERQLGPITMLSINTIIYSVSHLPKRPLAEDPFRQFQWLRERLAAARKANSSVYIVGHIPPGIETFGYTALWHKEYLEAYLSIVQDKQLGGVVAAQLFGHVHKDEFRLLPNAPTGAGPILLTSALSPIYRNLPSFRVVEYDAGSGRLVSWKTYYAELQTGSQPLRWRLGYDALQLYPAFASAAASKTFVTQASFATMADELAAGGVLWNSYAAWYATLVGNDLQHCGVEPQIRGLDASVRERCRQKYHCALYVADQASFDKCAHLEEEEAATADSRLDGVKRLEPEPPRSQEDFEARRKAHWEHLGITKSQLRASGLLESS
eukprot:TRINITY_DN34379_c0_g1_i1.p1 TRINITY_DN34379_c0_g1~~TRINITY_DN34379_c0_g1_i1.p1  ORF type:complete len:447 (-),score=100.82 TRINITY_DN34379_c0_g1_i1:379-1719(-)